MKFINFAVVKFSICLVLGIITAHFTTPYFQLNKFSFIILLVLLLASYLHARKQLVQQVFFGSFTFCCFFLLGYLNYQLREPILQKNHFTQLESFQNQKAQLVTLQITQSVKPDRFNTKYIARVISVESLPVTGKVLLQIPKKDQYKSLTIDDRLLVYGTLSAFPKSLNPSQFDYAAYMKSLGVSGQTQIHARDILAHEQNTYSLRAKAESLRNYLIEKLKSSGLKEAHRVIVQALILGERSEISKETNQQYADAGAIHILAVSGLHVGIVYMVFQFLLAPLKRFTWGAKAQAVLLILILFSFALLAGLSASVVRAATMFSLFIFAEKVNRRTSSINTLFLSFFGLLLINPLWLFQVGFQLSYAAVFFILWVQPKLYKLWVPKNYILRIFWGISTVSIAVQIGILPLSLYYFHQFPGLFLLTNLVILPALTAILIGGILFTILAVFDAIPSWYVTIYSEVIETMNRFIAWVSNQEAFLYENITFNFEHVLGSYLLIITLILCWKKFSFRTMYSVGISIVFFFGIILLDKHTKRAEKLVIFHKNRETVVSHLAENTLRVFLNDTSQTYLDKYPIKGYYTSKNISSYSEEILPKVFKYKEKHLLVVDSLGVYPTNGTIDVVMLTGSPKLHLDRLIDSLQPKMIVADGSNYRSYVERWRKTCAQKKLPFHHTGSKGALIFE